MMFIIHAIKDIIVSFVEFISFWKKTEEEISPSKVERLELLLATQSEELQDLKTNLHHLNSIIDRLPTKVLDSITSSTNFNKGKLGEMIGYLQLNAEYDQLICFGSITDFIGIKFPKDGQGGSLDFIDLKNGSSARLSSNQKGLKQLIEEKRIRFIKVKVDTNVSTGNETDSVNPI